MAELGHVCVGTAVQKSQDWSGKSTSPDSSFPRYWCEQVRLEWLIDWLTDWLIDWSINFSKVSYMLCLCYWCVASLFFYIVCLFVCLFFSLSTSHMQCIMRSHSSTSKLKWPKPVNTTNPFTEQMNQTLNKYKLEIRTLLKERHQIEDVTF